MKRSITHVVFLLLMLTSAHGSSDGSGGFMDDEYYRNNMTRNLQLASIWLIKEGVYTYNESGKNGIHRKLVDEWGVQIWVDPWIESERYIDAFWIKARGINHEVINFYREEYCGILYEFWVVKVDGQEWSRVKSRAEFFITKTDEVYGKREVLKASKKFIEEYAVDQDFVLKFPKNDLQVLYEMQAWLYPENFEGSDLKDKKVVMKGSGKFYFE